MMKKGIRFILAAALAAALPLTAHATSESLSGSALEGTADSASDGASDSTSSDYSSLWADRMTDGDSGSTLDDGSDSGLYDWTSGFDSSSMTAEEARQLVRLAEASQDSLKFETTTDVQTSFNEENNFYVYTFPNQNQIETSVPNGAMTSGPVILHISKDSTDVTATKDNETYSIGDGYYFSEPGTYELELLCGPGNYSGDNLTFYQYRFSFQIMKDGFSRQNFLVAPEGYEIVHVSCDGQPMKIKNPTCMNLRKDGSYQVRFSAEELPDYRLSFQKDTQAPTLTFSQDITKSGLKLPVSFEKRQSDSEVTVYRDGNEVELNSQTLNQGGWYQIAVSDRAGNSRAYHFFVKQTYHLFNRHLVTLIAAVLIGTVLLGGTGGLALRRRS